MMKRFSRKRRGGGESRRRSIDAAEWLPRIQESGAVELARLEPWPDSDVPDSVAAIGQGERPDGTSVLVAFSPTSASEATLAAIAAAQKAAVDGEFTGHVLVIAPQWPAGARRLLSLLGVAPYSIEPIAATSLAEGRVVVAAEPEPPILAIGRAQLAARLGSDEARAGFDRAALALEGLAAKHGGAVRVGVDRLELVVLARRVAELRVDGESAVLDVQLGGRQTTPLSGADLAGALDGLEGQIRRRLNDRRVREGEEGLRGRVVSQLAGGAELRGLRAWPLPGSDLDPVDAVAVGAEGEPVVVAVREELDWGALAAVLESMAPLASLLPVLFAEIAPPLRLGAPRLLLVAERFPDALERALSALTLAYELRSVSATAGADVDLVAKSSGEGAESRPAARRSRRRGGRGSRSSQAAEREPSEAPTAERGEAEAPSDSAARRADESGDGEEGSRGRGRRRRRPRRARGAESPDAEPSSREGREGEEERDGEGGRRRGRRFEEVSLMDLDEDPDAAEPSAEEGERGGGRRRRGRRRGRRGGSASAESADEEAAEEPSGPARVEEEDLVDSDDLEEILARLADDVPEYEAEESADLAYDDEEEIEDEAGSGGGAGESRRRVRKPALEEEAEDDGRPAPRRRSALLVHADRDSLLSAMLLARDIRQLDGIWVYPQSELMTFFRSVATDLRDETPIFVIGFSPSPARDVVQASSLYRGRLTWFDRHAWPPEDLMALRDSLGADAIHGGLELDSTLPLVLETCTRRSRFSDKLVDLATGRFTQHDFERWGRLWWWRAGEMADKPGDARAGLAPILAGRPSDLAKEASRVDLPPPPDEVAYVAERDFRLVHFGGHVMVVVPVEDPMHLHLTARIARERYDATLSLAHRVGGTAFAFAGDEGTGKRTLDYQAVSEHLAEKLEWVEARSDADHVARFVVRDLDRNPERIEELIGEIAMGRSLLER